MTRLYLLALLALAVPVVVASSALADDSEHGARAQFHVDAEIDPLAYIFGGHSLHVGFGYRNLRLDLGAFALDVPGFLESNDEFETSVNGFGAKFMVFPFAEQRGVFLGVDANLSHALIRRKDTELATSQRQFSTGVLAGVRIPLPANFYVTPWIGVSYEFGDRDHVLGGEKYDASRIGVFPTIHVGYQFL